MTPSPTNPSSISGLPTDQDELVFQAPWEARAFAIVNQLVASEHYSWSEWTDYLVSEIAATEKESPGTKTYYEQWVSACEKLLTAKGLLEPELIRYKIAELLAERESDHKH
ncbi:MAG: nitrile hydratase accessory protein [Oculatellaceae cyanobacterium bins.114]|nr:nitrile hydratase accessory protein [Oculatellaceae cyanobacterium bins.114]